MPYDNEYNRNIKSQYEDINRKFIEHQKKFDELFHHIPMVSGLANKNFTGGAIPSYLNSDIKYGINQGVRAVYSDASQYGSNYGEKNATDDKEKYVENIKSDVEKPMAGQGGFAKGTFRDTGFERTLGAGKGVKTYKKKMEGGKPLKPFIKAIKRRAKIANPLDIMNTMTGVLSSLPVKIPVVSNVADVLHQGTSALKSLMPDKQEQQEEGGRKRGRPKKMTGGTELGLPQKFVKKKGAGKRTRKPKGEKCGTEAGMEGAGFLSDLWKGIKNVAKPLGSVAKVGLSLVPTPQAQLASQGLGALGMGKKRGRPSKMKGGKLVPVANMKSSSMAGQGKPKNKRVEIVKKVMKEKGLSMIEASKYVKEHKLY